RRFQTFHETLESGRLFHEGCERCGVSRVRVRGRQPNAAEHVWHATGTLTRILEVHSMRSMLCFLLSGLVLFGAAVPAAAHHAFTAQFDVTQAVKIKGTTTKMEWSNPHAWLYVDVK